MTAWVRFLNRINIRIFGLPKADRSSQPNRKTTENSEGRRAPTNIRISERIHPKINPIPCHEAPARRASNKKFLFLAASCLNEAESRNA